MKHVMKDSQGIPRSPGLKLRHETQGTTGHHSYMVRVGLQVVSGYTWLHFPAEYQPDFLSRGLGSHNSPRLFPASWALQIFYPDESKYGFVWTSKSPQLQWNSNGLSIFFILNYEDGHFITGAIPAIPQFSDNPIILYEFNIWVIHQAGKSLEVLPAPKCENSKRQLLVAPSKTWTSRAGKVTGKLWPLTNGHDFLMFFYF